MGNKNGSVYVYKEKRVVVYMNIFCKQVTKKGLIILCIISHSKTIFQLGSQVFFNKAADRSRLDICSCVACLYKYLVSVFHSNSQFCKSNGCFKCFISSRSLCNQSPSFWCYECIARCLQKSREHVGTTMGKSWSLCISASFTALCTSP